MEGRAVRVRASEIRMPKHRQGPSPCSGDGYGACTGEYQPLCEAGFGLRRVGSQ